MIVALGGLGTETFSSDTLSLSWSHYSLVNTLGYPYPVDSSSYVYYARASAGGAETVSFSVRFYGDTFMNCYEVSGVSPNVDAESTGTSENYEAAPAFSVSSYSAPAGDFVFASGYQTATWTCNEPDFAPGAGYTYTGVNNCMGGSSTGALGDEYSAVWGGGSTTSPMTSNNGPGASSADGQEISIAFRPAVVSVPISLSPQNGAPADSAYVSCQGGGGAYAASGGTQYFSCVASYAVTLTLSAGGANNQWCLSGECVNSVSWTACTSGTCPTTAYADYEQLRNTFQETLVVGTISTGLSWTYTGYQSGSPGAVVCTSSPTGGGTSAGCSGWSDYGEPVTAPASPSGESASLRFEDSTGGSSTAGSPTSAGSSFAADYYTEEGLTVQYSLLGGGSPAAPTFTYTSLGTSESYVMTTSPAVIWVDYGSGWAVGPNPLAGSGNSQRWQSAGPLSGMATSPGAVDPSYYLQYTESLAYSVSCDTGATCTPPSLTYYQFGSTTSSTLSTTAQSFWIDSGSVASVSTYITDNLGDAYTPDLSSWVITAIDQFSTPVQYWSGL